MNDIDLQSIYEEVKTPFKAGMALVPGGTVALHRLVLVFKGGECVLDEEV